jgi:mono/diheme cytochrome c family protein
MGRVWSAVVVAGLLALACGGGEETGLGALELQGDASRGESLFAFHCASCHGGDGSGGSQGVDLREEVPHHSDRELVGLMANGKGTMPAPGLSDQQIADVLAYLRETFR